MQQPLGPGLLMFKIFFSWGATMPTPLAAGKSHGFCIQCLTLALELLLPQISEGLCLSIVWSYLEKTITQS